MTERRRSRIGRPNLSVIIGLEKALKVWSTALANDGIMEMVKDNTSAKQR